MSFDRADFLLAGAILILALAVIVPRLLRSRPVQRLMGDEEAKPVPQPRSVERFATLITVTVACLTASMWVESREIALSEPGGIIEGVLRKLDGLLMAAYKVTAATAFHSFVVDHLAYRSFTLLELHTNKPAAWRAEGEFQPFNSVYPQAAAVLGYWITWATVCYVFGAMAG